MKKRVFLIFAILFVAAELYSNNTVALINQANDLVENRKYLSAFQLLIDSKSDDSRIIAKEIEIATYYSVKSIMHTSFAFKDLNKDETIEELRNANGDFTMFLFDPRKIIKPKLQNKEDGILAKALGDWYYEVYSIYGNTWMNDEEDLIYESKYYYEIAYRNDIYDDKMLDRMAHYLMLEEKYDMATSFLKQSISVNEKYANPYYNLAFCYIQMGMTEEAIRQAKTASMLYDDIVFKYDALVMVAKLSYELNDFKTSTEYFNEAIVLYPKGYEPYTYLIYLYMRDNKIELSKEISKQYFNLFPREPNVNNTIVSYFINFNYVREYLDLTNQFLEENDNYEILGNIHLYRSFAYQNIKENEKAKLELDEAKNFFNKVFNSDHEVFSVIKDLYKQL